MKSSARVFYSNRPLRRFVSLTHLRYAGGVGNRATRKPPKPGRRGHRPPKVFRVGGGFSATRLDRRVVAHNVTCVGENTSRWLSFVCRRDRAVRFYKSCYFRTVAHSVQGDTGVGCQDSSRRNLAHDGARSRTRNKTKQNNRFDDRSNVLDRLLLVPRSFSLPADITLSYYRLPPRCHTRHALVQTRARAHVCRACTLLLLLSFSCASSEYYRKVCNWLQNRKS